MALQRQIVPAPFAVGPQDKIDPKQLDLKGVQVVENGRYVQQGKIQKRLGFAAIGGAGVPGGEYVGSLGDQLLVKTGEGLFSWAGGSTWTAKGACPSVSLARRNLFRAGTTQTTPHVAVSIAHGLEAHWSAEARVDGTSGSEVRAVDRGTRQIIWSCVLTSVSVYRIFAVAGGFVVVGGAADGSILVEVLGYASAGGGVLHTATVMPAGTFKVADACLAEVGTPGGGLLEAQDVFVVGAPKAGGKCSLFRVAVGQVTGVPAVSAEVELNTDPSATGSSVAQVGLALNTDSRVIVGTLGALGTTVQVKVSTVATSLADAATSPVRGVLCRSVATTGLSSPGDVLLGSIVCGNHAGVPRLAWVEYTIPPASSAIVNSAAGPTVYKVDLPGYVPGSAAPFVRGCWLQSRICNSGTAGYVLVATDSITTQGKALLYRLDGQLMAALGGQAYYAAVGFAAMGLEVLGAMCESAAGALTADLGTLDGLAPLRTGLATCEIEFGSAAENRSEADLGGSKYFSGTGVLWQYDGVRVVEHGFLQYPVIQHVAFKPTATEITDPGVVGQTTGKTYRYQAVYAWLDATGGLHRSAPTAIVAAAAVPAPSGGGTKTLAYVLVSALRQTAKEQVVIELYRNTDSDPTNYHYVGATANDPTTDFVACWGGGLDADIASNATIYTTGELKAGPAPVPQALGVFKNRLFVVDAEIPSRVWYTKQVFPGQPVEFTPFFYRDIDPSSDGGLTALGVLDEKLVLFKRDVAFFMAGDGPSPSGADDDFSTPILINTNTGCVAPRSVVTAGPGIVYQSAKGIFILDRALRDQYIGAAVESYVVSDAGANTVSGAALLPGVTEVRLTVPSSGLVLTYNWVFDRWSTASGLSSAGIGVWQSGPVVLTSDGKVLRETPGVFTDDGAHVALRITRGWMSFAGLSGFQRVWKMILLGDYKSSHQLKVTIAVDYNEDPVQTVVLSPDDVQDPGSLAGALGLALGGAGIPAYQYRIHMLRQKCQAIKVWIEELPPASGPGEGLSLSGLTFEVGALPGVARLPRAQSAG